MKKQVEYLLVLISALLIFGGSSSLNSRQFNLSSTKKEKLSQCDANMIYYGNRSKHSTDEDRSVALFEGVFNFPLDDNLLKEVSKNEKISAIYDYTALSFLNYYDSNDESKDCFKTNIKVNHKDVSLYSSMIKDKCIIAPYFKESQLDQNLEKIYMSSKLNNFLQCSIGDEICISSIQIPTGMNKELVTFNKEDIEVDKKYYEVVEKTFSVSEIIDCSNALYKTDYVILIPYTMMEEWMKEVENKSLEPYYTSVKAIFSKDKNISNLYKELIDMDPKVQLSSSYQVIESIYNYNIKQYRTVDYIFNLLTIIWMIGLFAYMKKTDRKENFMMILTIIAGSVITLPIINRMIDFSYLYAIINLAIIGVLLILYHLKFSKITE